MIFVSKNNTAVCGVKRIGVRIQIHIKRMFGNDAAQDFTQLLVLSSIFNVGFNLRRAVPQPHCRDIPGNNKITSVVKLCDGCLDGV